MITLIDVVKKDLTLFYRWTAAKNAAKSWLIANAKNGYYHSESVETYLDRLITDDVKEDLSPAEAFVLLYATYLHDIGKLEQEQNHEQIGAETILRDYTKFLLQNKFEAIAVSEVAYAHADEKEKPLSSLDSKYGVDSLSKYHTLDLQFLGALLRIADEIDNAYTRVANIPNQKGSVRNIINFVEIDPKRWIIEFQYDGKFLNPSEKQQLEQQLAELVDRTKQRLADVKDIFERHNLFYWIVVSRASSTEALPITKNLEEIRAKYLKRLADEYRYIDVRGILQVRKLIQIKLQDIYVPLRAVPYELLGRLELTSKANNAASIDNRDLQIQKEEKQVDEKLRIGTKLHIENILDNSRIVILGAPGSGKSTIAKYLALAMATGLGLSNRNYGKKFLPIVIQIKNFADALEKSDLTVSSYLLLFFKSLDYQDLENLMVLIHSELDEGNCLVLFDGLDEIRQLGLRKQVGKKIQNFIDEFDKGNIFVVTSRIAGYAEAQLRGDFKHYMLADFDSEDIKLFAGKWCQAFEEITNSGSVAEEKAKLETDNLIQEIWSNPEILRLASNPLLLTILALVHYNGMRLPTRRVDVYELCVKTLAESWNLARDVYNRPLEVWLGNNQLDERYITRILGPVALWMRESKEGIVSRAELEYHISEQLQEVEGLALIEAEKTASEFLELVVCYNGLLSEVTLGAFSFLYMSFEEYLAAKTLTGKRDFIDFVLYHLDNPRWRETIRLTAAMVKGDFADELVRRVRGVKDIYEPYLHRHLLIAGWCLVDDCPVSNGLRRELIMEFEKLILDEETPEPLAEQIIAVFSGLKGSRSEVDVLSILLLMVRMQSVLIKRRAVKALGSLGNLKGTKALDALIRALNDPDDSVRGMAVEALGNLKNKVASDALIRALNDQDYSVRGMAVEALGNLKDKKALDPLMQMALSDNERFVRSRAVEALGNLEDTVALDALTTVLKDNPNMGIRERERAVEALGNFKDAKALEPLIKIALKDKDNSVKGKALAALGNFKDTKALDLLIQALDDSDYFLRRKAVEALGAFKDTKARDALIQALDDSDHFVRGMTVKALGKFKDRVALDALIRALNDPDDSVRGMAVEALGNLKDTKVLDLLIRALYDPNNSIRGKAVKALGNFKGTKTLDQLIQVALNDPDYSVRGMAVEALGNLKDKKALEPLIKIALKDKDNSVKGKALAALGNFKDTKALDALIRALNDPNNFVKGKTVEALGAFKDTKALDALIRALNDPNNFVRGMAVEALGNLKDKKALDPLIKIALNDPDNSVRGMAVEALGDIKDKKTLDPLMLVVLKEKERLIRNRAFLLLLEKASLDNN